MMGTKEALPYPPLNWIYTCQNVRTPDM